MRIRSTLLWVVLTSGSVCLAGQETWAALEPPAAQDEDLWRNRHTEGVEALAGGRLEEAGELFGEAVRTARAFEDPDSRLAQSLDALGRVRSLEGRLSEAETLFRSALDILERMDHPEDPGPALIMQHIAETHRLRENLTEARLMYRRSIDALASAGVADPLLMLPTLEGLAAVELEAGRDEAAVELYGMVLAVRWGQGTDERGQARVLAYLDGLASVLGLAHFRDRDLQTATDVLIASLETVAGVQELYLASSRLLAVELPALAEEVLRAGLVRYPHSPGLLGELAEIEARSGRLGESRGSLLKIAGLERTDAGTRPLDAIQSRAYMRMGQIDIQLGRLDDAIADYRQALEANPAAPGPRVALGSLYHARDMPEDAVAEYRVAIELGGGSDAFYGLSEVYLGLNRFSDAERAAARALSIDPNHQGASYARARALMGLGRREEAETALATYREKEAEARRDASREMNVWSLGRSAVAAYNDGRFGDAVDLFRDGIRERPDAAVMHFNLAVLEDKLGRVREAVETYRRMLELGCCPQGDSFLVHRNLSRAYESLGAAETGRRHGALYLREYDIALKAALAGQSYP